MSRVKHKISQILDILREPSNNAAQERVSQQPIDEPAIQEKTTLDILVSFPLFMSSSAGTYEERAPLAIQNINQIFPFLVTLCQTLHGSTLTPISLATFKNEADDVVAANALKPLLDGYGSDKANFHNYHLLYGPILKARDSVANVLEIGLGTNNTDVVSNMGPSGKPGASIRAFRDFLPNAMVYGADIDKRILFSEERIKTFFVDQTDPDSFIQLDKNVPNDFDLIIDDGLHAINANVLSLNFGLTHIKIGGWMVVEDINKLTLDAWRVICALFPSRFTYHLIQTEKALAFAVQRIA